MSQNDYYATREARIDTIVGSATYYELLVRLSDVYKGAFSDWAGFADWCEVDHGFRPVFAEDGGITGTPNILDEQKYTLCLLKYSG